MVELFCEDKRFLAKAACMYLFKGNNRHTIKEFELSPKLAIKRRQQRQSRSYCLFIVYFTRAYFTFFSISVLDLK